MFASKIQLDPYQTFALKLGETAARAATEGYDCRPYTLDYVTRSLMQATEDLLEAPAVTCLREAELARVVLTPRAAPSSDAFRALDVLAEVVRALELPEGVSLKLEPRVYRVTLLETEEKFTACVLRLTGPKLEPRTYLVSTEPSR